MKKFFVFVLLFFCANIVFAQGKDCPITINGHIVKNSKIKVRFKAEGLETFTLDVSPCGDERLFEFEWTNLGNAVIGTKSFMSFHVGKLMHETTVFLTLSKIDAYFVQRIEITLVKKAKKQRKIRIDYN